MSNTPKGHGSIISNIFKEHLLTTRMVLVNVVADVINFIEDNNPSIFSCVVTSDLVDICRNTSCRQASDQLRKTSS